MSSIRTDNFSVTSLKRRSLPPKDADSNSWKRWRSLPLQPNDTLKRKHQISAKIPITFLGTYAGTRGQQDHQSVCQRESSPKNGNYVIILLPSRCFLKLYDLLYSVEDNIVKIVGKQIVLLIIDFHPMDNKTQRQLSNYLLLSSTE